MLKVGHVSKPNSPIARSPLVQETAIMLNEQHGGERDLKDVWNIILTYLKNVNSWQSWSTPKPKTFLVLILLIKFENISLDT
jgi:hypothetical protein